jgi:hypothetical protein
MNYERKAFLHSLLLELIQLVASQFDSIQVAIILRVLSRAT